MADSNQPGCLFVGEGAVLKGTFVVPDTASVSGSLEGTLSAKQVLIEPTGTVRGQVVGEVVDVQGELVEHLTASQSLIIRATGNIQGEVHYSEIEIEKGGCLNGDLHVIGSTRG
jgi:cytoskeletal protein CcmA (bactofilin family)